MCINDDNYSYQLKVLNIKQKLIICVPHILQVFLHFLMSIPNWQLGFPLCFSQ